MLTIRLQRVGNRNNPFFRIVLVEKHKSAKKQAVEVLGHYNPTNKDFVVKNEERLKHWIGKHVQMSPTIHNLFVDKGYVSEGKVHAWQPKRKPTAPEAEAGKKETKEEASAAANTDEAGKPEAKAEAKDGEAAPTPAEGEAGVPTESVGKEKPAEKVEEKKEEPTEKKQETSDK